MDTTFNDHRELSKEVAETPGDVCNPSGKTGSAEVLLDMGTPELPTDVETSTFVTTLPSPSSMQLKDTDAGSTESDTRVQTVSMQLKDTEAGSTESDTGVQTVSMQLKDTEAGSTESDTGVQTVSMQLQVTEAGSTESVQTISMQLKDTEAGSTECDTCTGVQTHQPADVLESQSDCTEEKDDVTIMETYAQEETQLKDEDAVNVEAMPSGGISLAEASRDVPCVEAELQDNGDTNMDVTVCRYHTYVPSICIWRKLCVYTNFVCSSS